LPDKSDNLLLEEPVFDVEVVLLSDELAEIYLFGGERIDQTLDFFAVVNQLSILQVCLLQQIAAHSFLLHQLPGPA